MRKLQLLIFNILLSVVAHSQGTGYVRLEGKQFKDENGNDFYPMIINYDVGLTTSIINNNLAFYLSPASSYGPSGEYECNTLTSCNTQFQEHFAKILSMGFNTIRIDLAATYRSSLPVTGTSRTYSVFYDENMMGIGNQYQSTFLGYDLDVTSNYTDPNSINFFNIIKNILTIANGSGLKVILVCGESFKDPLPPHGRIMWQTYDAQAASDFALYLDKLASEIYNYPALLAYDLINEPIIQEMYRDFELKSVTKQTICEYVNQWVVAIHQHDNNHLITLGSRTIDEVFYFDPGIMKIDFYSAHIYTMAWPLANYSKQNGLDRYDILNYWMNEVYPMPWIIGETGFSADDHTTPYPRFSPDNTFHNPPWMYGSEQEQADFAQHSLAVSRNAGASGYAWWAFQNVYWYDINTGSFDYPEDFFGLLHDGNGQAGVWSEKPAAAAFQYYLNASGQPPPQVPLAKPANYYDFYGIAANCPACITAGVQGIIVDPKGNPIKNAVVRASSWRKTTIIDPQDPNRNEYDHDISETFTDDFGTFAVYPYNYDQPSIANPHRVVSIEVTAVGAERQRFGADYPYGDQPMVSNINTQILKNVVNGYDAEVSDETVSIDEVRNYYGRNSLEVANMTINGRSDFTSRREIHINSEFHAHASSGNVNNETHIFISDAFPECPVDLADYLRVPDTTVSNEYNNIISKEIELSFNPDIGLMVEIVPNPNDGKYKLMITNSLNNLVTISLLNLVGEIILSETTVEPQYFINSDNLTKGLYIIHISNGQQLVSKKVIIH